jgi:hypothetical protein
VSDIQHCIGRRKKETWLFYARWCYSTLTLHGAEFFLRSCQSVSYSRISQHFMEPGPCPEPDQSSPYHPIQLTLLIIPLMFKRDVWRHSGKLQTVACEVSRLRSLWFSSLEKCKQQTVFKYLHTLDELMYNICEIITYIKISELRLV